MRILLIEDGVLIALSAEASLTEAGHIVIGPYKTHDDALAAAARENVDVAIVDINLAGCNEGLGIVSDLFDQFGVRSLFATGEPNLARANRGVAFGVLAKPYTEFDLVDSLPVIASLLDGGSPPPPFLPSGLELFH